MSNKIYGKIVNAMQKVFPCEEPAGEETKKEILQNEGTRRIFEISRNAETVQRVKDFASMVYAKAENETQDALCWHAEKEDLTLYFAKKAKGAQESCVYDGEIIVLEETATEKQLVDILNAVKPIERKVDENKIAKISTKRWDRFLQWHPDAYVTRIPIQQFLDMTTNDYVEQRQINARSSQISKQLSLLDIQNTAGEFMYLEVDFESGKVTSHEGRHRMTALLNAGNAYAHMEKRGSRYLRYALYNAAIYVCHLGKSFSAYLQKKRAEGKHYHVALSHAIKKLVRVIYRLQLTGEPYRPAV